jgi:hypothetical protein
MKRTGPKKGTLNGAKKKRLRMALKRKTRREIFAPGVFAAPKSNWSENITLLLLALPTPVGGGEKRGGALQGQTLLTDHQPLPPHLIFQELI